MYGTCKTWNVCIRWAIWLTCLWLMESYIKLLCIPDRTARSETKVVIKRTSGRKAWWITWWRCGNENRTNASNDYCHMLQDRRRIGIPPITPGVYIYYQPVCNLSKEDCSVLLPELGKKFMEILTQNTSFLDFSLITIKGQELYITTKEWSSKYYSTTRPTLLKEILQNYIKIDEVLDLVTEYFSVIMTWPIKPSTG